MVPAGQQQHSIARDDHMKVMWLSHDFHVMVVWCMLGSDLHIKFGFVNTFTHTHSTLLQLWCCSEPIRILMYVSSSLNFSLSFGLHQSWAGTQEVRNRHWLREIPYLHYSPNSSQWVSNSKQEIAEAKEALAHSSLFLHIRNHKVCQSALQYTFILMLGLGVRLIYTK